MNIKDLNQAWDGDRDILYNAKSAGDFLKHLNAAIDGLYYVGLELESSYGIIGASTYEIKPCSDILVGADIDPSEIAEKLRLIRSILFGGAMDWGKLEKSLSQFEPIKIEEA